MLFDPRHRGILGRQMPKGPAPSVALLGLWSTPAYPYIHDPFGLDEQYFEACFDRIDSAIVGLIAELRSRQSE